LCPYRHGTDFALSDKNYSKKTKRFAFLLLELFAAVGIKHPKKREEGRCI